MQSMKIANFKSPLSDVTSITERASVKHRMSHWDNTERICDRAYQNNRSENRTQILDHKVEDLLSFESAIFLGHFFFNLSLQKWPLLFKYRLYTIHILPVYLGQTKEKRCWWNKLFFLLIFFIWIYFSSSVLFLKNRTTVSPLCGRNTGIVGGAD